MRSRVDLPEPFGPRTARLSPGSRRALMPASAGPVAEVAAQPTAARSRARGRLHRSPARPLHGRRLLHMRPKLAVI